MKVRAFLASPTRRSYQEHRNESSTVAEEDVFSRASCQRTGKGCCYRLGTCYLSAAAQLNQRATVTVYERDDRVGGLLMYGIPNMKLNKNDIVERRLNLLREEGIIFVPNTPAFAAMVRRASMNSRMTARCCYALARPARDLSIPGRSQVFTSRWTLRANTRSLLDSIWTTATTSAQR